MARKIVAFYSPYPGAGKSTAASRMFKTTPMVKLSFADPLYNMCAGIAEHTKIAKKYGYILMEYKDSSLPELGGASLRDLLIAFGNSGRSVYPNLWVDYMRGRLNGINFSKSNVVIDDLRFPAEYDMLREEGAKIVRITNPERKVLVTESEGLLEGYEFDAEIVNDKKHWLEYRTRLDTLEIELWPEDVFGAV